MPLILDTEAFLDTVCELLRQGQQFIRDLLDKIRDGADKLLGWEEDE